MNKYNELCSSIEAILFAAGESVSAERIAKVVGCETDDVLAAAEKLGKMYVSQGSGLRVVRMDAKLQIVSASEYSDLINRTLEKRPAPRLSPTALEVLSIVAYYQPVTRAYIEQLRGADSSYTIASLTERGLVMPVGRLEAPGRPTLFGTTEQFLRITGMKSLEELPPLPKISSDEGMQKLQDAIEAAKGAGEQMELPLSEE